MHGPPPNEKFGSPPLKQLATLAVTILPPSGPVSSPLLHHPHPPLHPRPLLALTPLHQKAATMNCRPPLLSLHILPPNVQGYDPHPPIIVNATFLHRHLLFPTVVKNYTTPLWHLKSAVAPPTILPPSNVADNYMYLLLSLCHNSPIAQLRPRFQQFCNLKGRHI